MAKEKVPFHFLGNYRDFVGGSDLRDRLPRTWEDQKNMLEAVYPEIFPKLNGLGHFSLNGQILIDGNHLFLNSIRIAEDGIARWDKWKRDFKQLSDMECPYAPIRPRVLTFIAGEIIHRLIDLANRQVAEGYADSNQRFVSPDYNDFDDPELKRALTDNEDLKILENNWRIAAFDARMPDKRSAIAELRSSKKWRSGSANENIEDLINRIEHGKFQFYPHKEVYDYDLKNDYIDDLERNYLTDTAYGIKRIIVNGTRPIFQEKQVDSKMVLAMADLAVDAKIDWVCVVTNDSDIAPAIQRLQENGKRVFCLNADRENTSRALKDLVGWDSSFVIWDLFQKTRTGKSLWFENLFLPWGRIAATEMMLFSKGEPDKNLTLLPWDKSYREFQEEEWAALAAEEAGRPEQPK